MGQRFAIYTRLSRDPDGNQTATARQEADCRTFASLRGWEVVEIFEDVDLSAYRRGVERPSYERMLRAIDANELDGVLVWKLDRLVRRPAEFERFWSVCETRRVTLASANEPIDTSTELGLVIVRVLVAFASLESATMSVRIRSAKAAAATRGDHKHGGPRAFGLTPDWSEIVPSEAELIKQAADRFLSGDSLRGIVLDWRARGIKTTTGREWSVQALRSLLSQRRLAGLREHHGEIVAQGTWPAILAPNVVESLRDRLSDPARRPGPPVRSNLLTGFVRCGTCGGRMRGTLASNGRRRYACPPKPEGCNGTAILAEPLEELVTGAVIYRLDSGALKSALATSPSGAEEAEAQRSLNDDKALLEELAEAWGERRISSDEWHAARKPIERRIDEARRRLRVSDRFAALRTIPVDSGELSTRWPEMSTDRRRAVLGAVLDHLIINPAGKRRNVFDDSRVTPVWRV